MVRTIIYISSHGCKCTGGMVRSTLTAVAPIVKDAALNNNSTPVGYSPSWLIITVLSLATAGGDIDA